MQINEAAHDASGALDPQEFWHTWWLSRRQPSIRFRPIGVSGALSKSLSLR
jgi:hypothetical protein